MMYIHPRFDDYEKFRVLAVECSGANSPVFTKDGNIERFYIRTGASTTELSGSQTQEFVKGSPPGSTLNTKAVFANPLKNLQRVIFYTAWENVPTITR